MIIAGIFLFLNTGISQSQQPQFQRPPVKPQESVKYIHSRIQIAGIGRNQSYQPKPDKAENNFPKPIIGPDYSKCTTAEERQKVNLEFAQRQIAEEQKKHEELDKILKEEEALINTLNKTNVIQKNIPATANYNSPEFLAKTKSYQNALQNLKDMLVGKQKLSIANAYYEIENAYGDAYLSKKEYDNVIKESAEFIKKWLIQNGQSPSNNVALHEGI